MQTISLQCCNEHPLSAIANVVLMDAGLEADRQLLHDLCKWSKLTPSAVAKKARLTPSTVTRPYKGNWPNRLTQGTLDKLREAFPGFPKWPKVEADLPPAPDMIAYVPIDIMPTYAGMGGGGTGEGDVERALVPRYLIESVFRGQPADFVIIRTRGDSMFPDFEHDDEILVDKRDTSPVQPGPFAIWDADDEAYVVKNVEKVDGRRYRVFSTNSKYTPFEVDREETRIIGRPVWYGRRL